MKIASAWRIISATRGSCAACRLGMTSVATEFALHNPFTYGLYSSSPRARRMRKSPPFALPQSQRNASSRSSPPPIIATPPSGLVSTSFELPSRLYWYDAAGARAEHIPRSRRIRTRECCGFIVHDYSAIQVTSDFGAGGGSFFLFCSVFFFASGDYSADHENC